MGDTTTVALIVGLVAASAGSARVSGKRGDRANKPVTDRVPSFRCASCSPVVVIPTHELRRPLGPWSASLACLEGFLTPILQRPDVRIPE